MSAGSSRPSAAKSWWARATTVLLLTTGCTGSETSVVGLEGSPDPSLIATELVYLGGQDQEAEVGTLLPARLQVQTVNDDGAPTPGARVEWSFDHGLGDGRVRVDTVTADDAGLASMQWELGTSAGDQAATATLLTPTPAEGATGPSAAPKQRSVHFRARGRAAAPSVLEVSPASGQVGVGDTLVFSADVFDRHGNATDTVAVAWTAMDSSVVTTSVEGVVVGQQVGETTVRATAANLTSSASVTVVGGVAAPGAVSDLEVVGTGAEDVTLSWTAVDDGAGQPAKYALRYGSPTISWESAAETQRVVESATTGDEVTYTVDGLSPSSTYQFQAIAFRGDVDESPVFGEASDVATAQTSDVEAPGTISDLHVDDVGTDYVVLRWTAVDDGTGGPAKYAVRHGPAPMSWWATAGTEKVVEPDASVDEVTLTVDGLSPSSTYEFQAIAFRGTLNEDAVFSELSDPVRTTTLPSGGGGGGDGNVVFSEDWSTGFGGWDDQNTARLHSIVSDPTGAGRGDLLRVDFDSDDDAGWLAKWFDPPQSGEVHVRTHFYLADWGSSDPMKLVNVAGNRADNLWSSFGQAAVTPDGTDFFQSMSVMGYGDRKALAYTYHPDMTGTWGDEDWDSVVVPPIEEWNQLDHYVRLNDVGLANGVVRIWLNGTLVVERTGLRFRTTADLDLNMIMLSFNGASLTGNTLYYDNVLVYDQTPADLGAPSAPR